MANPFKDETVPTAARKAARRAFIRTGAQTLGAAIPVGGITAAALSEASAGVVALSIGAALLTAVLAASAAALDILAKGIPDDYRPELDAEGTLSGPQ